MAVLKYHNNYCQGVLNMSGGERKVKSTLELLGCEHKRESCRIPSDSGKGFLRFDFEVQLGTEFDEPLFIEYDGEGHYSPIRFGNQSESMAKKNYERTKKNDAKKDKWCKDWNHPLLRIHFNDFNNIEKLVKEFVEANRNHYINIVKT